MSVTFNEEKKIFRLDTEKSTYVMGLSPEGFLGHIYYGDRLFMEADNYLLRMEEPPYTPSVNKREKSAFLDFFPMEYPTGGIGDYRESCLNIRNAAGNMGCELHYAGHEIYKGKRGLKGLPASFSTEDEAETLEITLKDADLDLEVVLFYTAFEKENAITRSVRVQNQGKEDLRIEKILSACLDMDNENFSMLSLHGTWARERHIQTGELHYGKQVISSARGESSHQEHPFIALVTNGTEQENGKVYAMHFVYSGNFMAETELCQFDNLRMTMGINPEEFSWLLTPGEEFQAPEVVMVYSGNGLGAMTRSYHDFYRNHLIRSKFKYEKRPILINNWEATYFDFNTDKLLAIARQAKECGIEMLVMDDGWFGKRNFDNCSLGDWKVNEKKITGGLKHLVDEVNKIGLQFGIWFEPEMISPDSDLYRAHPDWAIQIAGREATQSRNQYVLDLSRPEVRDYAYECVASILRSANIAYVKWDMNRQLSDLGSSYLPKERQQELFHRYVLGVYELQERLVTEFPDLLLENCSGGGARFDPGMLYYSPQIWCSDNTDAVERLMIQEGSALIYPLSVIGAHVSDCPNHSVGRVTPFETRGHVALAGTFGYELDITKIPEEDRVLIPEQTVTYNKYRHLIQQGEYYRIASYRENHKYDCWALSSQDKKEVLVTYVQVLGVPNSHSRKVFLRGFDPKTTYRLEGTEETYTGEMLMKGGFLMKDFWGDFKSRLYHFIAK
ncbi:Alpha-galactosidase [uncultured Blautia sp.]|nr:alpha-galactosidase [uncultured Blautia sp.]SCH98394.1 Alpha-galactosidase [uncultured Blautia sp.]